MKASQHGSTDGGLIRAQRSTVSEGIGFFFYLKKGRAEENSDSQWSKP